MKLPLRRRSGHPRGQGLVEFALIFPLLLLLFLMAVDFGRVFFGWVAMHNAVRIGANYAAGHSLAWQTPGIQWQRDEFEALMLNDLQSLNCILPTPDPVADPIFADDADGDGTFISDGDLVRVDLTCSFGLLTPFAEALFGGPVPLHARADFAVYRTLLGSIPDPGDPPPGLCSPPQASFTTVPPKSTGNRINISPGESVTFTDTSAASAGCEITSWLWDFDDGAEDTSQGPVSHVYATAATYTASLTVTNSGGSDSQSINIRVAP